MKRAVPTWVDRLIYAACAVCIMIAASDARIAGVQAAGTAPVPNADGSIRPLPPPNVGATRLSPDVLPAQQAFDGQPALAALGARLFRDPLLSQPTGTACAGCHDPARGFAGGRVSRFGTAMGSRPGHYAARTAPTLLYVRYTPAIYFYQDDDAAAPEPRGGLFADGRYDSIATGIAAPLFNADEMNNRDPSTLARRLVDTPVGAALRLQFGADLFNGDPARVVSAIGRALEAYLRSDAMAPFSSRYDRSIRGEAVLTAQEGRGLQLFIDPEKGNCASCHSVNPGSTNPTRSLFTDYGYDALGVPRNRALPANADPRHHDEGLCRTAEARGWPESAQWCGYFKTPTLRNVALRERYMHNGELRGLREAVAFYATRSTDPARWYPKGRVFDDLPPAARANVNVNSVPLNRRAGARPALDDAEIDALVAFLRTLTDAPYEVAGK